MAVFLYRIVSYSLISDIVKVVRLVPVFRLGRVINAPTRYTLYTEIIEHVFFRKDLRFLLQVHYPCRLDYTFVFLFIIF